MAAQTFGYEQLTGISSAKPLLSIPAAANFGWVQVEGGTVRYRFDADPTTSVGQQLFTGQVPIEFNNEQLHAVKFIQESTTAKVNVVYFKHA